MIVALLVMIVIVALRRTAFSSVAPLAGASWMGVAIRTRRTARYFLKPFSGTG
jgi:hypothetical protein